MLALHQRTFLKLLKTLKSLTSETLPHLKTIWQQDAKSFYSETLQGLWVTNYKAGIPFEIIYHHAFGGNSQQQMKEMEMASELMSPII